MDNSPRHTRSGSETRQRTKAVRVRCTDGEHAQLSIAADRVGLTVCSFMRMRCLDTPGPRAVRRPPVERAALSQVLAQLGKCGSNLNQIARALNRGDGPPDGIAEAITEFRATCAQIVQLLGRKPE